ncbi:MAG: FKBP-type peptidyl-prolyl cis-trans isomerase [bacterium]
MSSVFILILLLLAGGCKGKAQNKETQLKTATQKFSYAVGLDLGQNFKQQGIDLDVEAFAQGLRDAAAGNASRLSDEEIREAVQELQEGIAERQPPGETSSLAQKNLEEGKKFLADNGNRAGVTTLPTGLQYEVIVAGTGPSPTINDTVTVHYRGTLIDGREFDSSYRRGEPATFPVTGVIEGWSQALPLMKVGSKWKLYIPPELAYGARGAGPDIGPYATLIFEVELLGIKGK